MLNQKGFSLVEVLVASLVILIGVTGYVSLQSQYVVANSNLNLRNVAVRLAADKLSDLQLFGQLSGLGLSYANVMDNSGGNIPFGDRDIVLSSNLGQKHVYATKWQVKDYFYVDSDFDGLSDKWVQQGDKDFPVPPPQYSDMKAITITIEWLDLAGAPKTFVLSGVLLPITLGRSFQAFYKTPSARSAP